MDDRKDPPVDKFHIDCVLPNGSALGRRRRDGEVSVALLNPIKEGSPIHDHHEIVTVSRGDYDKELLLESHGKANEPCKVELHAKTKGPARFSTPSYRSNFDGIFGVKRNRDVC